MYIEHIDSHYFVYRHNGNKKPFVGTLKNSLDAVNTELEKAVYFTKQSVTLALALEQEKHKETIEILERTITDKEELEKQNQVLSNLVLATKDDRLDPGHIQRLTRQALNGR